MFPYPKNTKEFYDRQILSCRSWILLVGVITVLNILLTLASVDMYFYLSAFFPYFIVVLFAVNCGVFSEEFYRKALNDPALVKEDLFFEPMGSFVIALVIALVITAVFFLLWYFSKKKPVLFLIAALLMGADAVTMLFMGELGGATMVIGLVIHGIILYQMILGFLAGKKKKTAPSLADLQAAASRPYDWESPATGGNDSTAKSGDAVDAVGSVPDNTSGNTPESTPENSNDDDPFAPFDQK